MEHRRENQNLLHEQKERVSECVKEIFFRKTKHKKSGADSGHEPPPITSLGEPALLLPLINLIKILQKNGCIGQSTILYIIAFRKSTKQRLYKMTTVMKCKGGRVYIKILPVHTQYNSTFIHTHNIYFFFNLYMYYTKICIFYNSHTLHMHGMILHRITAHRMCLSVDFNVWLRRVQKVKLQADIPKQGVNTN